ncbi:MAG TPA: hypothetical protein VL133_02530 [Devosia sp.]|nr:hypothetical protein [Devosia sp.]
MTVAPDAAAPHPSTTVFRRPALMWWPIAFAPDKPRLPPGLSQAQLLDAGIPLERAGYGRSADVSALTITMLEAQR